MSIDCFSKVKNLFKDHSDASSTADISKITYTEYKPSYNFFQITLGKIADIFRKVIQQITSLFSAIPPTTSFHTPTPLEFQAQNFTEAVTQAKEIRKKHKEHKDYSKTYELDEKEDTAPYKDIHEWANTFSDKLVNGVLKSKIEQYTHGDSDKCLITDWIHHILTTTLDPTIKESSLTTTIKQHLALQDADLQILSQQISEGVIPFIDDNAEILKNLVHDLLLDLLISYQSQLKQIVQEFISHLQATHTAENMANTLWEQASTNVFTKLSRMESLEELQEYADIKKIPFDQNSIYGSTEEEQLDQARHILQVKRTIQKLFSHKKYTLSTQESFYTEESWVTHLEKISKDRLFAYFYTMQRENLESTTKEMLLHYHATGKTKGTTIEEFKKATVTHLSTQVTDFIAKKIAETKHEAFTKGTLSLHIPEALPKAFAEALKTIIQKNKAKFPELEKFLPTVDTLLPKLLEKAATKSYSYVTKIIRDTVIKPLVCEFSSPTYVTHLIASALLPFLNELTWTQIIANGYSMNPQLYAEAFTSILSTHLIGKNKAEANIGEIHLTTTGKNTLFDIWYEQFQSTQDAPKLQTSFVADTLQPFFTEHIVKPLTTKCKEQETVSCETIQTLLKDQCLFTQDNESVASLLEDETCTKILHKTLAKEPLQEEENPAIVAALFARMLYYNPNRIAKCIQENGELTQEKILNIFREEILPYYLNDDLQSQLFQSAIGPKVYDTLLSSMHIILEEFAHSSYDTLDSTFVFHQLKENPALNYSKEDTYIHPKSYLIPKDSMQEITQISFFDLGNMQKGSLFSFRSLALKTFHGMIQHQLTQQMEKSLHNLSQNPSAMFIGIQKFLETVIPNDVKELEQKCFSSTKEQVKAPEDHLNQQVLDSKIQYQTDLMGLQFHHLLSRILPETADIPLLGIVTKSVARSVIPEVETIQEGVAKNVRHLLVRQHAPDDSIATHGAFLDLLLKIQDKVFTTLSAVS